MINESLKVLKAEAAIAVEESLRPKAKKGACTDRKRICACTWSKLSDQIRRT